MHLNVDKACSGQLCLPWRGHRASGLRRRLHSDFLNPSDGHAILVSYRHLPFCGGGARLREAVHKVFDVDPVEVR